MGLLDDAIREHLDLKRRRGADPTEIERAEREALGPVRRGPGEPSDPDAVGEPGLAYDHEEAEDWDEPFDEEPALHLPEVGAEQMEPFEPPLPHDPPTAERPDERWASRESPASDEWVEFDEPDVPDASAPASSPAPATREPVPDHLGEETAEYDVERELAREHPREGQDEDVLKETPEFLQDTPDHDRLWFEQRPPRDFDFEG
jgi:hypothetical protein